MSKRMRESPSDCVAIIYSVPERRGVRANGRARGCGERAVSRPGRMRDGTIGPRSARVLRIGIDIGGSSVKAAALRDGTVEWTARSAIYERPGRAQLDGAIAEALSRLHSPPD